MTYCKNCKHYKKNYMGFKHHCFNQTVVNDWINSIGLDWSIDFVGKSFFNHQECLKVRRFCNAKYYIPSLWYRIKTFLGVV